MFGLYPCFVMYLGLCKDSLGEKRSSPPSPPPPREQNKSPRVTSHPTGSLGSYGGFSFPELQPLFFSVLLIDKKTEDSMRR